METSGVSCPRPPAPASCLLPTASRKGFTLIELVVVTAIIALMLMMAAGSFDFLIPEYRLRAEARKIGEHMRLAKGEALTSGQDVYIGYDLKKASYWVWVWQEVPEERRRGSEDEFDWQTLFETKLDEGIHFVNVIYGQNKVVESDVARVRVTPMGTADHHIVNLKAADGSTMAVRLNGVTGVVTFYGNSIKQEEYLRENE